MGIKGKKVIAILITVSQVLTNTGTSILAASFSEISKKALESYVQDENISTKYYEEYHFESSSYLFNDGDGGGESTEDDIEETSTSFNNEVDFDAESDKPYDIEEPEEEDEEGSKN
ncbi:MAG: hypothetical protein II411_05650, partial [Lachnospiraceae bacterium]|nr:hypothetical protein [Lachnospiraceae bacterium]